MGSSHTAGISAGERLERILAFLGTAGELKAVYRAAYLSDLSRHESSAEHVFHACLWALLLHETCPDVDLPHALELLLIHDLIEVYAGDSALHDEDRRTTKAEREGRAASRLFGALPADLADRLRSLWAEFEDASTPEARFAGEIDRLQAIAQNVLAGGRTWADYQVTEEIARERNARAMGFEPRLAEVFEMLYERARREGLWHEPRGK